VAARARSHRVGSRVAGRSVRSAAPSFLAQERRSIILGPDHSASVSRLSTCTSEWTVVDMYLRVDGDVEMGTELLCPAMAGRQASRRRTPRSKRAEDQSELPLTARPKQRGGLDPEQAAKVAVARRVKPGNA